MTDPQQHNAVSSILRFFEFDHLPEAQQEISRDFCALAHKLASKLSGPELTVGLRKLLESKDAAVRASLEKP